MTDEKIETVESVDNNEVVKPKRGRPTKTKEKESVDTKEIGTSTDTQLQEQTMPQITEEAKDEETDSIEVTKASEDTDTGNSDGDKLSCCNCAECNCMKVHALTKVCKIFRGPAASLVRSCYKGNVKVVGPEVHGFVPVTYVRGGVGLVFGWIRKQDLT